MTKGLEQGCAVSDGVDEFVRVTTQKLRLKLLDLTARNPLISFKHGSRARRYVRVIDELPNQLFERLGGESGMRFRSLGQEANEPEDEKTVVFRRALAAAKLEDSEYRQKLDELGDDPGEKAIDQLDLELRQRLREQLGMPARRAGSAQSPADVARQLGLNPAFDLPASPENGEPETRHTDSVIQTLLFEDDMQATLARMRDVVRLSIGEMGVNPLFCVFGFLEWYEDTNSQKPLHAPLLLCPLAIERKLVRGNYHYSVKATGEETQVNVAIAERLKRDFNLVLPPYEDGDTPETYFTNVQQVIQHQKAWKVRRWITAGLFSFARIAMYHDLAPERWGSIGGLEKHEVLSRLIGGGNGDGDGEPVKSEDGETAGNGELETPLIADADSSQLAALRDVLSGRNLVIEGPPGTGKSQTITNIIAAALTTGKTVLFLAEKMAALNVVRDRLIHAGLEDFCLELHSTKAGRKETAAALARRLNRKSAPQSNVELEAALARLATLRDRLARYTDAVAQPAGKLGISVQELLWRCYTVRQQSKDVPSEVDEILYPDVDELTDIDIGRIVSAVEQFERARSRVVDSYGSILQHPWHGVARADIDPIRAEDIVRRVRKVAEAADDAQKVLQNVTSLTAIPSEVIKQLEHVALALLIKEPEPLVSGEIVSQLATPQILADMEHFASELLEYARTAADAASVFEFDEAVNTCSLDDLVAISGNLAAAGFEMATIADLPSLREERQRQANAWQQISDFVGNIARRANSTAPGNLENDRALAIALESAARADAAIMAGRDPSIIASGASTVLLKAVESAANLQQRRLELTRQYQITAIPESTALREHARAVRSAPIIAWISRGWRQARRAFFGIAKERRKIKRAELAQVFDDLASYVDDVNAFLTDDTFRNCIGPKFKGIDTDLPPLLHVAQWADEVRAALPAGDDLNNHLRRLLFEGPPDQIESLASLAKDHRMAQLLEVLRNGASGASGVAAQARAAAEASKRADQIGQVVYRLRLNGEFKLADCLKLSENLGSLRESREHLDSSETAKRVLGDRFKGHATDPQQIIACLKFVREVDSIGLPVQVRNWLLQIDAINHLRSLRKVAEEAKRSCLGIKEAFASLTRIAEISFSDWLGSPTPMDLRAADLRDHAGRCALDPDGFQALIDDLRAKRDANEVQMGPLLELFENNRVPLKGLGIAAKRVIFQSIARDAISRSAALASFSGDRHEACRADFRELDHKLKRLHQNAIASLLAQRSINPGVDKGSRKQWTGMAAVRNEASKQKGHAPVRDLMDRAGKAIQQLMPCFMMSPLSVAQYLTPGKIRFDLIVMDEASQLRPEDAIGAIGRGTQLVVVGDPKQLPPTNFFRETDEGVDDEDESAANEASILDQALSIMRPARRLKWHYRSRHASLIAFSNKEFYDNQLIVFPSPYDEHPDFGLRYVHVGDGAFRSRVNIPEAQAVAKAAIEYVVRHPDRSLGIVTLNKPQAELLSLEIDRLATEHEAFEAWRQKQEESLEPFFVKNLENVQGDERDAIFISTVYGPDEPGKNEFPQRFGPINNEGGHRRLNVLFTRSKCQTIVFSSMDPAYMRTDEKSAWGVRALKGYLKFAKDGVLETVQETGRSPDSDFEVSVMDTLKAAGFEVVPQVGVVGYFIDLAIRHPNRPGEFVLGVECDGATYHSSKSARDRDRLRQEVLERLNWRIHRIWSLDWYKNALREKERLLKAVSQAIAAS